MEINKFRKDQCFYKAPQTKIIIVNAHNIICASPMSIQTENTYEEELF